VAVQEELPDFCQPFSLILAGTIFPQFYFLLQICFVDDISKCRYIFWRVERLGVILIDLFSGLQPLLLLFFCILLVPFLLLDVSLSWRCRYFPQ
jgi:hypothetical protein